jgi:putative FmdB family regulatory protein
MPIYEYFCPSCKTEFELRRPFSESDKSAPCPHCGAEGQKLISGFASKTGSYIQGVTKPFRKGSAEDVEK